MIRVGICDDDPMARAALGRILDRQRDLAVTASVAAGEQALAHRGGVDVWLMDVRMRGMSGVAACAELRRRQNPPAVIMLTAFPDSSVADAVTAGAAGFLYKDVRPEHLVSAVHAASRGLAVLSPDAISSIVNTPLMPEMGPEVLGTIVRDEIDEKLADLVMKGLAVEAMAEALNLSDSGLKKRLGRLMERAGVSSRPLLMARLYTAKAAHEAGRKGRR